MKAYIYSLFDPRSKEIRYIGKANNPTMRLYRHLRETYNSPKCRWIKSLLNSGVLPEMDILEEVDASDWEESERFYIGYFRFLGCRLTNLDAGGAVGKGRSDSTRVKLREISSGRRAWNKGKKASPEARAKMSAAASARVRTPVSEETRQKLRVANTGKAITEEQRAKISKTLMGNIPWNKGRRLSQLHRNRLSASHKGLTPWNKGLKFT